MAPALRIGASSWSAPSWEGVFYPKGTLPADYLSHYASQFDTVEVDSTFCRVIIDRSREMARWIAAIRRMLEEGRAVYGYFNNHYAGYAVGSIRFFWEQWGGSAGR